MRSYAGTADLFDGVWKSLTTLACILEYSIPAWVFHLKIPKEIFLLEHGALEQLTFGLSVNLHL